MKFLTRFSVFHLIHLIILTSILFIIGIDFTFKCKNHEVHLISISRLMMAYGLGLLFGFISILKTWK